MSLHRPISPICSLCKDLSVYLGELISLKGGSLEGGRGSRGGGE